jgi:hypothetical protein
VRIVNRYQEDWGSKRMSACYWYIEFQFSGALMSACPHSAQYIKSVTLHGPSQYGYSVINAIPDRAEWTMVTMSQPPWRVQQVCSHQPYRVCGEITDVNDKVHPFTYLIPGDNVGGNLEAQ